MQRENERAKRAQMGGRAEADSHKVAARATRCGCRCVTTGMHRMGKGDPIMLYGAMLALAAGLGLPIAVISAALGQGRAAAAALEGIARQPEAAGKIQTAMIIGLALIESLVIYALLMFFMLQGKLPAVMQVIQATTGAG